MCSIALKVSQRHFYECIFEQLMFVPYLILWHVKSWHGVFYLWKIFFELWVQIRVKWEVCHHLHIDSGNVTIISTGIVRLVYRWSLTQDQGCQLMVRKVENISQYVGSILISILIFQSRDLKFNIDLHLAM